MKLEARLAIKDVLRNIALRLLGEAPVPPAPEYRVGSNVVVYDSALFDTTYGRHIFIDDDTVVAGGVRILAHDGSSQRAIGATLVAPVHVGKRCFIGQGSTILPGVTIGDDCVVGAGAVVTRDVEPNTVVAGVPARAIRLASELHAKRQATQESQRVLFHTGNHGMGLPDAKQLELIDLAQRDGGYFITWSEELAK